MKAVLIGPGMVASTHLLAIRDATPAVELVAVLGRDPGRSATFAEQATGVLGYPVRVLDTTEQIARTGADFAIVTTPPDARKDLIDQLTSARIPILMEKPVERSLETAAALVALCHERSVPLGIVLQHRAREASLALKATIEAGHLGDIATLEMRIPWWRDQSYYDAPGRGTYARDGGGVMINQAIHTLDLALWLAGPVTSVQAMMHRTPLHRLEAEDWAGALLHFSNGAAGSLCATTAAFPGDAESISVQGTKAAAHLASGILTLRHLDGRTETIGEQATTGGGADPMAFTHAWHQSVLENFVSALTTNSAPLATGESALMAHAVIDAMERSQSSGQQTQVNAV